MNKRILVDEQNQPIAVQVDYDDWLSLQAQLESAVQEQKITDLSDLAGTLTLSFDALEYQRALRREASEEERS